MIDEVYRTSNISELFLVPILNIPKKSRFDNGYINSYLFNAEESISYPYSVSLLFHPKDKTWFNTFLFEEEERGAILLDEFDYPGGYVIVVYKFPYKWNNDYNLILEGKYSKVSEEYKKNFQRTILQKGKPVLSLQWLIFNKHEYLKSFWESEFDTIFTPEQEYWGLYNIERETFKLKKEE